jgi:hypothetical protein
MDYQDEEKFILTLGDYWFGEQLRGPQRVGH